MAAQQGLPMLMQPPPSPHPPPHELRALHNRARKAFAKRHYKRAAALYSSTLERCEAEGVSSAQRALIYCNRAVCHLRAPGTQSYTEAVRDAERARHLASQETKAHFDLALSLVKERDDRLNVDFSWLPGAQRRHARRANTLTAAPHSARLPSRTRPAFLPRLNQSARRPKLPQPSPRVREKIEPVPTPRPGADTSLADRELRLLTMEQARTEIYDAKEEEEEQKQKDKATKAKNRKNEVGHLLVLQDMTEDPILRSTTPELDILTPPVLRESLVRSRSDQLFKEAKQRESEQKVALSPPTERPEAEEAEDDETAAEPEDVRVGAEELQDAAQLRAELEGMKLSALKRRAREAGVDEEKLEEADDEDDIKAAVVGLIVAMSP